MTWRWYGKRGINIIRYAIKANWNVPRVVLVQDITVKPPVLVPLRDNKCKAQSSEVWATPVTPRTQCTSVILSPLSADLVHKREQDLHLELDKDTHCSQTLERDRCFYLEDVGFSLAVDACERSVDGPRDSPHILDEFGVTRKYGLVIQLEKIFTLEEKQ